MRQIIFAGSGGPDVIRLEEVPVPQPGPGQVLIKVAACGINRPDCLQRAGFYPPPPGAPPVPGLEVAGTIAATGPGASLWQMGDRVCALLEGAGYAEYALAAQELCLPVPAPLSLVEAACLPETAFTVYDNLFTRAHLQRGETLLVQGGSGGIGSMAIAMASARNIRVLATTSTEEKAAFCRSLGAQEVLLYAQEDILLRVRELTKAHGVDVILDMAGASNLDANLACLALDGRLVILATQKGAKGPIDLRPILTKRLILLGSTLRPRSLVQKAAIAKGLLAEIWPLLESGALAPPRIHATFPLEQAALAHQLMESGAHCGKIALVLEASALVKTQKDTLS
jgi:NADPH:quinone reductase